MRGGEGETRGETMIALPGRRGDRVNEAEAPV